MALTTPIPDPRHGAGAPRLDPAGPKGAHGTSSRRRLTGVLLAGLALLAPLIASGQALEPVTVHQKWYHSFQFAGFHAARMQGFYAEAGLEVELREGLPGRRSLQALLEGEADFAVVGPEALVDYHSGRPLMALAAIFQHDPNAIVVRAADELATPADLVGRRVAISLSAPPSIQVMFHLERVNLAEVRTVVWQAPVERLIAGEIDGFASYLSDLPWHLERRGIDYRLIRPAHFAADFYSDLLVTTRQYNERNPDRVAAFREATLRGWSWALENPAQIIGYLLELPSERPEPLTRDQLGFEYEQIRSLIQVEVAELGHLNTSRLLRMSQAMREAGLIDAPLRPMDEFVWQPRGHSAGRLLFALAATLMLGLLATLFFLGWNRQLKRQVRQRTRQLTQQIDRREKTEFAYRQLVENSVQGMLIHTAETLIFANRRFCQMTGYERDEILAMSPGELVERCVHPDDHPAVQRHLRERLDDVHAGQHNVFRSIRRDGQIRHVEIFSSKVDFESRPALQSTFIDVTERVRAERGMQRRLGVERMLARQSAALLQASAEELGDHLQRTLENLMKLIDADVGCLIRRQGGEVLLSVGDSDQVEVIRHNAGRILESIQSDPSTHAQDTATWRHRRGNESIPEQVVVVPLTPEQHLDAAIVFGFSRAGQALEEVIYLLSMAGTTFSAALAHRDLTNRMEYLAAHDHLTGLPNRYKLIEELGRRLAQAGGNGERLGVMLIDLDNFKLVNDSLGHGAGDQLLRMVASILDRPIRRNAFAARLGGDEFVIVSNVTDDEDAVNLAEELLQATQKRLTLQGLQVQLSPSVGISVSPEDGVTAEQLLQAADSAMYAAKSAGKGCYRFYSHHMNDEATTRLTLESQLREALGHDQLLLHFQPVVDLADRRVTRIEALLRWNHPERGLVAPGYFLNVAEQSGLIRDIDDWVFNQSCEVAHRIKKLGLDWRVSVNLSARELHTPQFMQQLIRQLNRHWEVADQLEIEITESMLMTDIAHVTRELSMLKRNAPGIRVAIDDFGSGYSSLNYLRNLPIDTLKIDRSFIADLETAGDPEATIAVIRTIVDLGRNLKLQVVAEGIETERQREILEEIGCRFGQGFLFSRPVELSRLIGEGEQSRDKGHSRRERLR